VRFGTFSEHPRPRLWSPSPSTRWLENALEQIEPPARLGISEHWEVMHHFL
jgi:hypothetical protein